MDDLIQHLKEQGFEEDAAGRQAAQQNAEAQGMGANGEYTVLDVLTRGEVVVTIEQNQAPEDVGGLTAVVTHPPLAIVASPKGRVAANPEDVTLVAALVDQLS